MRISGNDADELLNRYKKLNESSTGNMGSGTPAAVVVPAPGDNASGGSGKLKAPGKPFLATAGVGPGSEFNEEEIDPNESKDMAKGQLLIAAEKAIELYELINSGVDVEPWVAAKITLASDYIETVADYMKYNKSQEKQTQCAVIPMEVESDVMVGEAKQRLDPKCWSGYRKAGTKMKSGIRVNKCVKVKKKR